MELEELAKFATSWTGIYLTALGLFCFGAVLLERLTR